MPLFKPVGERLAKQGGTKKACLSGGRRTHHAWAGPLAPAGAGARWPNAIGVELTRAGPGVSPTASS